MFKVFGIQRTGTTYLRELIKHNFGTQCLTNELGWKHGEISDPKVQVERENHKWSAERHEELRAVAGGCDVFAVIIIKNPYTWLQSIERWGKRAWKEQAGTGTPAEYFALYNKLYASHKKVLEEGFPKYCYKGGIFVQYEALLSDRNFVLAQIAKISGVEQIHFDDVGKVQQSADWHKEKRNFYLNPKYNPEIAKVVDWEIANFYGYKEKI